MAKLGSRRIRTPFRDNPTQKSRRQPIIIPQPIVKPLNIRGADLVDWEALRNDPLWFTLHKRTPQEAAKGDPREARAVQNRTGSLPERIVYKYLTVHMKLTEGIEFEFQSAQEGGRVELGGFVADFVFKDLKLVIQVQGVFHKEWLQGRKDEQQEDVLAEFGYQVESIWEDEIYDEYRFENRMRKIFNLASSSGSSFGSNTTTHATSPVVAPDQTMLNEWLQDVEWIKSQLEVIV
jgi:very-short-patch-repair endonuclease